MCFPPRPSSWTFLVLSDMNSYTGSRIRFFCSIIYSGVQRYRYDQTYRVMSSWVFSSWIFLRWLSPLFIRNRYTCVELKPRPFLSPQFTNNTPVYSHTVLQVRNYCSIHFLACYYRLSLSFNEYFEYWICMTPFKIFCLSYASKRMIKDTCHLHFKKKTEEHNLFVRDEQAFWRTEQWKQR